MPLPDESSITKSCAIRTSHLPRQIVAEVVVTARAVGGHENLPVGGQRDPHSRP
jgi:hypothetical protein